MKERDLKLQETGRALAEPQKKPRSRRYLMTIILFYVLVFGCTSMWESGGCSVLEFTQMTNSIGGAESHVSAGAAGNQIRVYFDLAMTGIITPTQSVGQLVASRLQRSDSDAVSIPFVDELTEKGYLAVRVPHVPPTYTQSSIITPTIHFMYRAPPNAADRTTVSVTVTQRSEYLTAVNARYPITDGQSHWEIWWLPASETFPIPRNEPFKLEALSSVVVVDFGAGVSARDCAGCPFEFLFYNGYTYIGPYTFPLVFEWEPLPAGNPLVAFGPRCGQPSVIQSITPTVPFTHTHWLESYDTVTRTFTIDTSSSQGWGYTYYTKRPGQPAMVPVSGAPFTVTMGPKPQDWPKVDCIEIMAVNTPTIAISDSMRETFAITATSVISPEVHASNYSIALAPSYDLQEGMVHIFLPVLLK